MGRMARTASTSAACTGWIKGPGKAGLARAWGVGKRHDQMLQDTVYGARDTVDNPKNGHIAARARPRGLPL